MDVVGCESGLGLGLDSLLAQVLHPRSVCTLSGYYLTGKGAFYLIARDFTSKLLGCEPSHVE